MSHHLRASAPISPAADLQFAPSLSTGRDFFASSPLTGTARDGRAVALWKPAVLFFHPLSSYIVFCVSGGGEDWFQRVDYNCWVYLKPYCFSSPERLGSMIARILDQGVPFLFEMVILFFCFLFLQAYDLSRPSSSVVISHLSTGNHLIKPVPLLFCYIRRSLLLYLALGCPARARMN